MADSPPDPILTNAIARRDAALAEVQRWDDFIRMYRLVSGAEPGQRLPKLDRSNRAAEGRQRRTSSDPAVATGVVAETEALARQIILETGRAMTTQELLHEMAARSYHIRGQNAAGTLSARLSRAPTIENERPFGWRIRRTDTEIGAAGHPVATNGPANSDPETPSRPVEPGAGGGT